MRTLFCAHWGRGARENGMLGKVAGFLSLVSGSVASFYEQLPTVHMVRVEPSGEERRGGRRLKTQSIAKRWHVERFTYTTQLPSNYP